MARGRYALFRTTRIFADLLFMSDALRLAVILHREVKAPWFFKVQRLSAHRVGHVAKLRSAADLRAISPYLEEAYRFAAGEEAAVRPSKSLRATRRRRR